MPRKRKRASPSKGRKRRVKRSSRKKETIAFSRSDTKKSSSGKYEKVCEEVAQLYNHRSTPTFEDVYAELIDRGVPPEAVEASPKMQRLCARLDPRKPPPKVKSFTQFLMQSILHKLPGTLRQKTPIKPTLRFVDADHITHKVKVEFPSLAHWSLFAYNREWRSQWENSIGAPTIRLPSKWKLSIGKYLGSWADAADSESEDETSSEEEGAWPLSSSDNEDEFHV